MMLGIDFGTSNSAVALVGDDGVLQGIPLEAGRPSMPTALFFSNETGQVFYGSAAMQAYLSGTDGRLMRSIKSVLGTALFADSTRVKRDTLAFSEILGFFVAELKRRAEDSRKALEAMGYTVQWHTYPMPHSVHPKEVADISAFLRQVLPAGKATAR